MLRSRGASRRGARAKRACSTAETRSGSARESGACGRQDASEASLSCRRRRPRLARSAKRLARSRVHRMVDGVAHAASLLARGAPAGRSPAPAEAGTPALGTSHAAACPTAALSTPPTEAPERAKPAAAEAGKPALEELWAAGSAQPAAWNVPRVGMYASAGAGLRPAGAPRVGLRSGMGYTVSHPMDAAPRQPLGAARQARALRLQDRLASLASCEPRAPGWTRLRPSGSACGAWSLRSRSAGRSARAPSS